MVVELTGCEAGRLIADSAAMGQAVIVAASGVGQAPTVGETFRTTVCSRIVTYRTEQRRPHLRGWLVTLSRVD